MPYSLDSRAIHRLAHSEHVLASQLSIFIMNSLESSMYRKVELEKISVLLEDIELKLGIQNKPWHS